MKTRQNNYAYIDGANLYEGIRDLGWQLDYHRFRKWLRKKYSITKAYLFIGLIPKYKDLYTYLQEAGFTLVFKETVYGGNGKPKGNCDADLVLYVVRDLYEGMFDSSVIVSSDGDYASVVQLLLQKNKLTSVISPSNNCSILIKRTNGRIVYLDQVRTKVDKK